MGIKSGLSVGPIEVAASSTDTPIHAPGAFRTAVTASVITNNAAINVTVQIYESPNATSASGELLETITLAPSEEQDVISIVGQGFQASQQIIARVTTAAVILGDVISKLSYTMYTGDS
jgi:hypothetical protein